MPYGPTKFVNGQNQGAAPVNTQVLDNDIKVIMPPAFANAKAVFPMPARSMTAGVKRGVRGLPPGGAVHAVAGHPRPAVLNGLMTGAVYALVALGLTLIYGVLHIINFAHGALLSAALFAAFFAYQKLGLDPYLAVFLLAPLFFALGYALQRFVIGPAVARRRPQHAPGDARPRRRHRERAALRIPRRHPHHRPALRLRIDRSRLQPSSPCRASLPSRPSFVVALVLWLIMRWTDTGKAIRAVAREKLGAELAGIDVAHIYAVTFGLGTACVAIAACLLIPTYYVNPGAGNAFVLIAFTIVVLGGMGSVPAR